MCSDWFPIETNEKNNIILCWPLQRSMAHSSYCSSHTNCRLGPGPCLWTNRPLMLEGSSFPGTQELFVLISFDRPFVLSLLCHCRPHEEIWQQPLPLSPTPSALSWQPALPGPPTHPWAPHPSPLSLQALFYWYSVNNQQFLVHFCTINQRLGRGIIISDVLCVRKFMHFLSELKKSIIFLISL